MSTAILLDEPVAPQRPSSLRRGETRRRVTIEAAWGFVHGGYYVPEGRSEAVMFESDIARLRERIADPVEVGKDHWRTDTAKIEEAKRIYAEGKRTYLESLSRGNNKPRWEEVADDYEGPRSWQEAYVRRNYHFADNAGYKTVHPVRELIVHDEVIAPPAPPEQVEAVSALRAMMSELMRSQSQGGSGDAKRK